MTSERRCHRCGRTQRSIFQSLCMVVSIEPVRRKLFQRMGIVRRELDNIFIACDRVLLVTDNRIRPISRVKTYPKVSLLLSFLGNIRGTLDVVSYLWWKDFRRLGSSLWVALLFLLRLREFLDFILARSYFLFISTK